MYYLKMKNRTQWVFIAFIEYFLYMIIFSLYFQVNTEILIYIAILSYLLLYRDYSILKRNYKYFKSISKKIFIIIYPLYFKNLLERLVILLCIIGLLLLWDSDMRIVNDLLQALFLLVAFNYKHIYRLKLRNSVVKKVCQLSKEKGIGKVQLYNNYHVLYATSKDLSHIKRFLDQEMDVMN